MRFQLGVSGNETAKWKPGQSGNPAGKSKRRAEFEETFNEALITEGSPQAPAGLTSRRFTAGVDQENR